MKERIIDLDAGQDGETVVLVRVGAVAIPVNRARLLELLAREQAYLAALAATPAPDAPVTAAAPPGLAGHMSPGGLAIAGSPSIVFNHRSLSNRIKKIHDYCVGQRELRASHVALLGDLLRGFDWVLPEHPNTQLEFHLGEIRSWKSVPQDLLVLIDHFLSRYRDVRYRQGA